MSITAVFVEHSCNAMRLGTGCMRSFMCDRPRILQRRRMHRAPPDAVAHSNRIGVDTNGLS